MQHWRRPPLQQGRDRDDDTAAASGRAQSPDGWNGWSVSVWQTKRLKYRRMEFELKAAQPPEPITYKIISNDPNGVASLIRVDTNRAEIRLCAGK